MGGIRCAPIGRIARWPTGTCSAPSSPPTRRFGNTRTAYPTRPLCLPTDIRSTTSICRVPAPTRSSSISSATIEATSRFTQCFRSTSASTGRPSWRFGARTIPSSFRRARRHSSVTFQARKCASLTRATLHLKRTATRSLQRSASFFHVRSEQWRGSRNCAALKMIFSGDRLMRAIVLKSLGGLDSLVIKELPEPEPKMGHVVIHVKAFRINHAEIHMRRGEWAEAAPVTGIECVGLVKSAPGGEFPVGAKVAALMGGLGRTINGSYAEYTRAPVSNVALIEADLPWAELAVIPDSSATAWTCLFRN